MRKTLNSFAYHDYYEYELIINKYQLYLNTAKFIWPEWQTTTHVITVNKKQKHKIIICLVENYKNNNKAMTNGKI